MSVLIKLQKKGQMVIPQALRDEAGVSEGTLPRVAVIDGGQFLITPQLSIDRSLVYECAEAANAAYIVTENTRHFKNPYKTTRIVNARQLLDLVGG